MNADLQRIADNAQIPPSQVLREVLIFALFGQGYLADHAQWDLAGGGNRLQIPTPLAINVKNTSVTY